MLTIFNIFRGMDFPGLLVRLLLAVVCGTAIGVERSAKNRPAGFRTHILVCLGASVAAVTGHFLYLGLGLPADVTRLSGQVITGLGFIGAGTIILTKSMTIKGLTTAAGLWTTGVIGLSIGSGFYEGGLMGTFLVLFIETVLGPLGHRIPRGSDMHIEVLYDDNASLNQVMRFCKDRNMSVRNLQVCANEEGSARFTAILDLRTFHADDDLLDKIRMIPGVVSAAEL